MTPVRKLLADEELEIEDEEFEPMRMTGRRGKQTFESPRRN
jgi:hypothetical protein